MPERRNMSRRQFMKIGRGTIAAIAVARDCQALTLLRHTEEFWA